MNASAAKSAALGCVIATGAIASVDALSKGQLPPLRIGVGVFVAGALLLALADAEPELAAGFAFLLLTGAVLREGIPAASRLNTALHS